MECREAQQLVKSYINGTIEDKELYKFLDHIEQCDECYEELEINYTIFSTLMQLDDTPDVSYNINAMLQEKLNASRKYIRRKKRYRFIKIIVFIVAVLVILIALGLQLDFWF